jgi:hypothetical protein
MVQSIRSFLSMTKVRIRRDDLDAAAFVVYHSVRATMLARLLEAPPGLDDQTLVTELTDLLLRYLVADLEERPSTEPQRPLAQKGARRVGRFLGGHADRVSRLAEP